MNRPIRVIVVDDSALVRQILESGLNQDPGIEVVGTAADPYVARDKIMQLRPDVLTLDVEMPRIDGVAFLQRLMPQYPMPVVMVSSLTQQGKQITLDALDAGAVDFVSKPSSNLSQGLNAMLRELVHKIYAASRANVSHWRGKKDQLQQQLQRGTLKSQALTESTDKVIAIGASTSGTEALKRVLAPLPATTPGIVVVQHMPQGFTKMFAQRLDQICALAVKEAQTGDRVRPGQVLIAAGGQHLEVERSGGFYHARCREGEKVSGHCPSADVLFNSVAQHVGRNAVGVILTGMGADGAQGLLAMHKAGARNLAQDEASSVVFGMPKEAYNRGAAEALVPLEEMGERLLKLLEARA